jgi:hypothetical protein
MSLEKARRPIGLRLIIGYKLVKAPVMLALALSLTFAQDGLSGWLARVAAELAEGGWLLHRIGLWLGVHVTGSFVRGATVAAWLDTASTSLEAVLLLMGKAWGEWLVVAGIGCLIPLEVFWLGHHPTWGRFALLGINSLFFAYLLWRRLRAVAHRQAPCLPPPLVP